MGSLGLFVFMLEHNYFSCDEFNNGWSREYEGHLSFHFHSNDTSSIILKFLF
jgi:hypothetical protein